MGLRGTFRTILCSGLMVAAMLFVSPGAHAMLSEACPMQSSQPNPGACPNDPKTGAPDPNCISACTQAQTDCAQAQSTCQGAGAKDAADAAKGAQDAANAGNAANGLQGANGAQAPNAASMCAGQDANNARQQDGQPVPPAMEKCAASAQKCAAQKNGTGGPASQGAKAAGAKAAAENAARAAEGAQMGQKCQDSNKNEGKMPSIPPPPPPPEKKKKDEKPEDKPPFESELTDKPKDEDKKEAETAKVDSMNFGEDPKTAEIGADVNPGGVSMIPPGPASLISGSSPAGAGSGGGSGPEYSRTGAGGQNGAAGFGPGSGLTSHSGGGFGSGSGASSLGSNKSSEKGIASADLHPEGNGNEVNPGGGKSVLGLKSSGDSGEDIVAAALKGPPGADAAKGDVSKAGADGRGPAAGAGKGSAADLAKQGFSLFQMVKSKYVKLRELGQI
jgi:hypothetical protein